MTRVPIVVLASGRGTNFMALADAARAGRLPADIRALVSDKADAPVLARAKEAGIEAISVPSHTGQSRDAHDREVLAAIAQHKSRWLVMAGYMRLVSPALLAPYADPRGFHRVTNIHPSLLPMFPGLDAYGQAHRYGSKITGATVHLVSEGLDDGPICAQEAFSIADCHSAAEIEARGLALEHRLYVDTLAWLLTERFSVEKMPQGRLSVRAS